MDVIWLLGRILFGALFIGSGIGHFAEADSSAAHAATKNVPQPKNAVLLSGAAFLLGGLSIILGVFGDLGALAIILTLLPTTFLFHRFWEETDPMVKQVEMSHFMKNLSLTGGALVLFSFFAREYSGDFLAYTMTDGFFAF
jgi:putative oxidoreductase